MAGVASILASRLPMASKTDIQLANKAVKLLRATASQSITIWKQDIYNCTLLSVSDAGGVAGKEDSAQLALMVLIADRGIKEGEEVRVTPLGWRSGKSRRVVNSTLAGEAMAASAALAEAEWIQQIVFDVFQPSSGPRVVQKNWALRDHVSRGKRAPQPSHRIPARGRCEGGVRFSLEGSGGLSLRPPSGQ